jgi:hypothetical protein
MAWFSEAATGSIPLLKAFVSDEVSPGAAATGIVALGLLGEPATIPFIWQYLDNSKLELRWAAAFALTRFGIADPALVEVVTEVVTSPAARTETMSFLSGSYMSLAAMALAEVPESTTLRTVDAVLSGLADCTGVERFFDRYYTAGTLFTMTFPGTPADPPQSFRELSDAQQHVVSFVAERARSPWSHTAVEALRRWNVPTAPAELRDYAGCRLPALRTPNKIGLPAGRG